MRRHLFFLLCALLALSLASCRHFIKSHTDITISESGHYFKMLAWYNRDKTTSVEEYMDHTIGRRNKTSFINSRIDGTLGFDDHTTFYIKKYPGYLEIKLDKNKNSSESHHRVKNMCEGLKNVMAN